MPNMDPEERERFRGLFLDALDAPYDFKRVLGFLFRPFVRRLFNKETQEWIHRWFTDFNSYICSSFAQRCFFLAAKPEKRTKRLFLQGKRYGNLFMKMENVTPGKIAQSTNTIWLYNPHP